MIIRGVRDCWNEEQYQDIIEFTSSSLWRFIQHNASYYSKEEAFLDITGISRKNLTRLCEIHFLLTEEVGKFVTETAPAILNRLSKNSLRETSTLRGRIKGKVLWSKTMTTRYVSGGDPSLFVCQQCSSIFDLPENRVLLFVLKQILRVSENVLGTHSHEGYEFDDRLKNNKWINVVKAIAYQSSNLLRNPYIREISEIHDLTENNIQETEKARGANYTQLAITARILNNAQKRQVDFLHEKLSNRMLQPLNRDVLYEVAVMFRVIEYFRNSGWTEKTVNLIGGGSKIISKFTKNNISMNIYYQGIPDTFIKNSKYKDLMDHYQVDVGYRRPDIILEWVREGGQKSYCIVEVKRSKNREYLIDGLYKLLGYIKDFEEVFVYTPNSKGILVGWETNSSQSVKEEKEFYLAGWNDLKEHLTIIERGITKHGCSN